MSADLLGEGARIVLWQIDRGSYEPGGAFPGPAELEFLLGLPTQAVRHAIHTLLECGVLRPGCPLTVARPERWRIRMPVPDVGAERVARHILVQINSGTYRGGARLPSVSELATRFHASYPAVQDALRLLAAREIVTGCPPQVGRPLAPPRRLKYALAREAVHEEQAKAGGQRDQGVPGQQRQNAAAGRVLAEFQALLAGSGLPDQESVSGADAVCQWLRARIEDGTYGPGERLPSGPKLAAALGVTRSVVDAGRKQLVDEGLLHSDRNRGTKVATPLQAAQPLALDRADGGQTLTQQIETRIRELLVDYEPGERLPSIRAWADSFGASKSTVRASLQPLRRDGLVEARGPDGSFATTALNRTESARPGLAADRVVSTSRADPARRLHGPAADHHD